MSFLAVGLVTFIVVAIGEILAQQSWISVMRTKGVSQVQKAYGPKVDEAVKAKVPSMGGVVFMLIGSGFLISGLVTRNLTAVALWGYPVLCGAIGLTDDVLKFRRGSSEGFSSKGKFLVQMAVTIVWFAQLQAYGLSGSPSSSILAGVLWWLLAFFLAVGAQNALNVTDGLDGLAAGASLISFSALCFLAPGAEPFLASCAGAALCAGFLWHNAHPAQVFMGDGGSHFLAGLLVSIVLVSGMPILTLVPVGFLFGVEMISVVIQLVSIHGRGKKVFLMAPIHHHFQLKGWPENLITWRFMVVHLIGLAGCLFIGDLLF